MLKQTLCFLMLAGVSLAAEPKFTATDRGVVVETDRYKATISSGVVVSFVNKFTNEEYLDASADLSKVLPHLPTGLGTQDGEAAFKAAGKLFDWPWNEHAAKTTWPNQHHTTPTSQFKYDFKDGKAVLTYKGLTDGTTKFDDESYVLTVEVDIEFGDLVITPAVSSPRKGVYGAALPVAPLFPTTTIEAPIFDGMQVDRHMEHNLYVNGWPGFWDYGFLALNGYRTGAVGVWCQDNDLKIHKQLYYLVNEQGLSFSLNAMNNPPFESYTKAEPLSWRFQAYDKSWSQAVARYRQWRNKVTPAAPRAPWTQQLAFMNNSVDARAGWLAPVKSYFENKHLDRTVTFAATIRRQPFDRFHADNTPYQPVESTDPKKPSVPGFKEDMANWKASGAKLMAYLQPMIFVISAEAKTDREKAGLAGHYLAETRSPFQADPKRKAVHDQHHLGEPSWQRWFLDWVKEYIQGYNADGVYHDQSYHCPMDNRGTIATTSPQGMADYFKKAQAESPNSVHGTEHMNEVNSLGTSVGIGSGILWGSPSALRHQRINHASPISNALQYERGATFGFPHYSDFAKAGLSTRYHWGLDLMEKRGDMPGNELQNRSLFGGNLIPFQFWRNEYWLDRCRATTFVWEGLRQVFPEDFSRDVYSYYRDASGRDYRIEKMPWGSRFVRQDGPTNSLIYARIHGVTEVADFDGAVAGWYCYKPGRIAGLHPDRYYIVDPNLKRPAAYWGPGHWSVSGLRESYVEDAFANEKFAYLKIRPNPYIGAVLTYDTVMLHSPVPIKKVLVGGRPFTSVARLKDAEGKDTDDYRIGEIRTPSDVVVFFDEPADSITGKDFVHTRVVSADTATEMFDSQFFNAQITVTTNKAGSLGVAAPATLQLVPKRTQTHILVKTPGEGNQTGRLKVNVGGGLASLDVNAQARPFVTEPGRTQPITVPMLPGETALLTFHSESGVTCTFEWKTAEQLKAEAATTKE
ncbi:MAG: hypothetical protein PCFJNLEI_00600 [Verrucomicrobiae bacterium]|nr:hypothetical protein [Verrucomicrobiae bacterium]